MKFKTPAVCTMAAILTVTQAAPAFAYGHYGWHGHGHAGPIIGLFAVGAALVIGTAELLTAPIRAIDPAQGGGYAPGPVGYGAYNAPPPYANEPPNYYAQAPAYYPPRRAYYAPPPYYAAPPAYYGRPYYGG